MEYEKCDYHQGMARPKPLLETRRAIPAPPLSGTGLTSSLGRGIHLWEINQYNMLPHQLATAYGYVLPPLEIALGILLVVGLLLRVSSAVSVLVVLSFAVAKIQAIARGLDIDICPCFGPAVPLLTAYSLALDVVLLVLAVQIFFHRGEFLALGPWFSRKAAELDEQDDD